MKWLSMALTDDRPEFKPESIVICVPISDVLTEDTPAVISFLRAKGWALLADLIERERM